MAIETSLVSAADIFFPAPARQGDQCHMAARRCGAHALRGLETVDPRQAEIQQDRIGLKPGHLIQRLNPVMGDTDFVVPGSQQQCQAVGDIMIIVNHQQTELAGKEGGGGLADGAFSSVVSSGSSPVSGSCTVNVLP